MTAYHDLDAPQAMRDDAAQIAGQIPGPVRLPAPTIRYDAYPQDLPKPQIEVSEAAQRLADALGLYLD